MPTFSERLALIIDARTGGAVTEIERVGKKADDLGTATGRTTALLSKLGITGAESAQALSAGFAVAGAAAAVGIAKFAVDSVSQFAGVTREALGLQRVIGGSAEDASRFSAAFRVLGVDTQAGGRAIAFLGAAIGNGKDRLAQFGIEVARTSSGQVDLQATVLNVADAWRKSTDATTRDALAKDAFGKGFIALLPVLAQGRDGLNQLFREALRHHQIFSADDLERGRQFDLAVRGLKESFSGLEIEAGRALLPFITGLAHASTAVVGFIDKLVRSIGNFFGPLAHDLNVVLRPGGFGPLAESGGRAKTAVVDLAQSSADLAVRQREAARAADEQTRSLDKLQNAAIADLAAHRAVEAAHRGVTNAIYARNQAQEALSDLLRRGAVDARAVESAERSLQHSSESLAAAQKNLAQAQADFQRVQQGTSPHQLAEDQLSVAQAIDSVAQAQRRLNDLQRGPTPLDLALADLAVTVAKRQLADAQITGNSISIAQGRLAVDRAVEHAAALRNAVPDALLLSIAEHALEAAQNAQTDAQARLTAAILDGRPGSASYAAAQDRVALAARAVTAAQESQALSQAALSLALAGDPDFQDKVARARHDVADKTQAIALANYAATLAAYRFGSAQLALNLAMAAGSLVVAGLYLRLTTLLGIAPEALGFVNLVKAAVPNLAAAVQRALSDLIRPGYRAAGGPVRSGGLYVVGERGPELLSLGSSSGNVIPNNQAFGGGDTYITVNMPPGSDGEDVVAALRRYLRRNGKVPIKVA